MTRCLRRVAIAIAGSFIVLIGIALLVLPGPGLVTIAAGLSLLGSEFDSARRCLEWCKARSARLSQRLR